MIDLFGITGLFTLFIPLNDNFLLSKLLTGRKFEKEPVSVLELLASEFPQLCFITISTRSAIQFKFNGNQIPLIVSAFVNENVRSNVSFLVC